MLVPTALRSLGEGDPTKANAIFEQIAEIGERFGDVDLIGLSLIGRGQALVKLGKIAEKTRIGNRFERRERLSRRDAPRVQEFEPKSLSLRAS